jgi:small neutral amino acid transporter SnatA (MarC family)
MQKIIKATILMVFALFCLWFLDTTGIAASIKEVRNETIVNEPAQEFIALCVMLFVGNLIGWLATRR